MSVKNVLNLEPLREQIYNTQRSALPFIAGEDYVSIPSHVLMDLPKLTFVKKIDPEFFTLEEFLSIYGIATNVTPGNKCSEPIKRAYEQVLNGPSDTYLFESHKWGHSHYVFLTSDDLIVPRKCFAPLSYDDGLDLLLAPLTLIEGKEYFITCPSFTGVLAFDKLSGSSGVIFKNKSDNSVLLVQIGNRSYHCYEVVK